MAEGDIYRIEDNNNIPKEKIKIDFSDFFTKFKKVTETETGQALTQTIKRSVFGPLSELESLFKPLVGFGTGLLTSLPFKKTKQAEITPTITKDDMAEGIKEGEKELWKSDILTIKPEKNFYQDFKDWYGSFWEKGIYSFTESLEDNKEEQRKGLLTGLFGALGVGALSKGLKGFLGNVFKGLGKTVPRLVRGLGKGLVKAAPFLALAGGIIWGVVDAIKGVMKAKQWGTSKVSAGIAAFFAGTKSGWRGAFANMGKWALIGSGIGMMAGGPIGALAGGMAGAAIGGLLGFIGGQRIAQVFDKLGQWVSDNVKKMIEGIKTAFSWLKDKIITSFSNIKDFIGNVFEGIKDFFETKFTLENIGKALLEWNPISLVVKGITALINKIFGTDVELNIKSIGSTIVKGITSLVRNVFGGIDLDMKSIGKSITDSLSSLLSKIGEFFGNIDLSEMFRNVTNAVKGFFGNIWEFIKHPFKYRKMMKQAEETGEMNIDMSGGLAGGQGGYIVTKPSVMKVGESRPEAIIPLADEKVIVGSLNALRQAEMELANMIERQITQQQRQAEVMTKAVTNITNNNQSNITNNIISPVQSISDIPSNIYDHTVILASMGVI